MKRRRLWYIFRYYFFCFHAIEMVCCVGSASDASLTISGGSVYASIEVWQRDKCLYGIDKPFAQWLDQTHFCIAPFVYMNARGAGRLRLISPQQAMPRLSYSIHLFASNRFLCKFIFETYWHPGIIVHSFFLFLSFFVFLFFIIPFFLWTLIFLSFFK